MKYTVEMSKKVLGSFDEQANAELFAKAYEQATGNKVEVVDHSKPKAEPKTETPEIMDESPVAYAAEHGMKAFEEILNGYTIEQMKALIKAYKLDPNGILRRSKNIERVRTGIYSNVEARATHGNVFRYFEG